MRRWFLSYNSQDVALMARLEAELRRKDSDARIYFAPKRVRAGSFWLPELANEIAEATAFVLLVGEKGLGPWQILEYYEALDQWLSLAPTASSTPHPHPCRQGVDTSDSR
jgi:hypothetical protein